MLPDVLSEWEGCPGELHTITGFTREEYQILDRKLNRPDARLEIIDTIMLEQAAKQFFGYPGMTTANVAMKLGSAWRQAVKTAFLSENGK